jgi:hypothetical protein
VSVAGSRTLRAFRRPRVWTSLWAVGWMLAIVLSLIHPPRIGIDVPQGDKLGHLLAYGVLSAWAANLFATRRAWWLAALALVALGIGLEFAQGAFTVDRQRDPLDALADAMGVACGMLVLRGRGQRVLQALDERWFAPRLV